MDVKRRTALGSRQAWYSCIYFGILAQLGFVPVWYDALAILTMGKLTLLGFEILMLGRNTILGHALSMLRGILMLKRIHLFDIKRLMIWLGLMDKDVSFRSIIRHCLNWLKIGLGSDQRVRRRHNRPRSRATWSIFFHSREPLLV